MRLITVNWSDIKFQITAATTKTTCFNDWFYTNLINCTSTTNVNTFRELRVQIYAWDADMTLINISIKYLADSTKSFNVKHEFYQQFSFHFSSSSFFLFRLFFLYICASISVVFIENKRSAYLLVMLVRENRLSLTL